jgi:hypothetical protein
VAGESEVTADCAAGVHPAIMNPRKALVACEYRMGRN